jgi:hypothetical protein
VANRKYVQERLESQYSLELTRGAGPAAPAATATTTGAGGAAGAPRASEEKAGAPTQGATPGGSGLPIVWIALGAVAIAVLVGGVAYRLGKSSAPPR